MNKKRSMEPSTYKSAKKLVELLKSFPLLALFLLVPER